MALSCAVSGRVGKIMVVVFFFLTLSDMSKLVILLLQYCPGSSLLEAWSSTMALSSISDCLRQCFAGVLELKT